MKFCGEVLWDNKTIYQDSPDLTVFYSESVLELVSLGNYLNYFILIYCFG